MDGRSDLKLTISAADLAAIRAKAEAMLLPGFERMDAALPGKVEDLKRQVERLTAELRAMRLRSEA